ncbi:MAG TPA: hypothetical protein VID48_10285 [Solirubrobacteraceae bacterium]
MRRVVAISLVLVAGHAVLIGCGSATTSGASGAPTKAHAIAYAKAVNLKPADLPRMHILSPEGSAPALTQIGREAAQCAGFVNPDPRAVRIRSAAFSTAGGKERILKVESLGSFLPAYEGIRSDVTVLPSIALAVRNSVVARSQRVLACLARGLTSALTHRRAPASALAHTLPSHFGTVTVSRLPDPLPSVPGSFGARAELPEWFKLPFLGARTIIAYVDIFGFVAGQSEVGLYAEGSPRPVPAAAERKLLSLLYNRAMATKL